MAGPTPFPLRPDGWLSSIQCFLVCTVEMNLAWNLTERDHLALYYKSAGELRWLACFQNQVCVAFNR